MFKINFLKPDKSNLNTFLYLGSFLFFLSVLDVALNSFFSLNITTFLPGFLSFLLPLILGFIGLYLIRIEFSGIKNLDLLVHQKGFLFYFFSRNFSFFFFVEHI